MIPASVVADRLNVGIPALRMADHRGFVTLDSRPGRTGGRWSLSEAEVREIVDHRLGKVASRSLWDEAIEGGYPGIVDSLVQAILRSVDDRCRDTRVASSAERG